MMNIKNIDRWMLLLLAVLLTACHSDSKEEIVQPVEEDCYLDIYVYAPDRPVVTRSDVGEIAQRTIAESKVNTLQIWVFKHNDGSLVGYLNEVPSFLNETTGYEMYRMKVSRDFADNPQNVDVYVVANAGNSVTKSDNTSVTLGDGTIRSELNEAMIGTDFFGTTNLVSVVPDGGLPMSAVLKNQSITGSFPTLRIGTETEMATLRLTRAVSKLRFVLCRIKEKENTSKKFVSIDGIQLNGGQIPKTAYLMPGTYNYSGNYVSDNSDVINFVNPSNPEDKLIPNDVENPSNPKIIPEVDDPLEYVYETEDAQTYETKIENAVKDGILRELGLTYLRESDKQLKGTITYTYKDGDDTKSGQTADFLMAAPGDFLRNHSWIIYVYYMDSKIYTLTVTTIGMKKWTDDGNSETTTFYNW